MSGVDWFDAAHAGQAGFGLLVGTRGAFGSILRTMMPPSFIEEFFGDREVQS